LSGAMSANCDAIATQLSLEITQTGNQINFKFVNTGSVAMFIDSVYFSDPLNFLAGTPTFTYSPTGVVSFNTNCNLNNPPNFNSTDCGAAVMPSPKNGVNPSEWVQASYVIQSPGTQNLSTLLNSIDKDTFNIGVKVQGFASGSSSEWAQAVPEPGTLLLFGSGLGIAALRRRRAHA